MGKKRKPIKDLIKDLKQNQYKEKCKTCSNTNEKCTCKEKLDK